MPLELPGKRGHCWTWGGMAALAVVLATALAAGQSTRPAGAQAIKTARPAVSYRYRQSNVLWHRIDVTLNEWAEKGWEMVQIVPVINPNPGAGGTMQVAIVFRQRTD